MKYNIHITHAAERDMANAYDYIDLVLKNPTAADKLLDVADEKIGALAEFPHKFEVVSDKLLSLWGIRFTIVMNYLAFYTVDDATQTVHIVRFLYGKITEDILNKKTECLKDWLVEVSEESDIDSDAITAHSLLSRLEDAERFSIFDKQPEQEQPEATISFYVAECMEFQIGRASCRERV